MSAASYLEHVASRLIPSEAEQNSIATTLSTLQDRLHSYFGPDINAQMVFGSLARATMLPRHADPNANVDYMVVFDNRLGHEPSVYVDRLRRFAEASYARSEIQQSHPCVALSINQVRFDLVPATRSSASTFDIPDPRNPSTAWIRTEPERFNFLVDERNRASGYVLKPAIRLLKYWNARGGPLFDSFGLEHWLAQHEFSGLKFVHDYFFEALHEVRGSADDPLWKRDRLQRAKAAAAAARTYEAIGMPANAEHELTKLVPEP